MSRASTIQNLEKPPRLKARITGALYLLTILTGLFAQGYVSRTLVVDGDAVATATNILAHKSLFQLAYAVFLIEMACQVAITALFYDLLKPAGRSVSLVAAFLGLAGSIIKTFARVFFIVPLFVLGGAHFLSVFSAEQLQALALLFLKVNDRGAGDGLGIFRVLCAADGLSHYQVHLPASDSGRRVGSWRSRLVELSVSSARTSCVSLRCSFRPPRGNIADCVAARCRGERTTMDGASQGASERAPLTQEVGRIR